MIWTFVAALVDRMLQADLVLLSGLLLGLALGVAVVLRLRASQVWRYRQALGYSVYGADRLRAWLLRRAGLAALVGLAIAAAYIWRELPSGSAGDGLASVTALAEESQRLVIPRLGLDVPVVEAGFAGRQWDLSLLHERVGHLGGTSRPGQPGNAVLAGHVTLAGGRSLSSRCCGGETGSLSSRGRIPGPTRSLRAV